VVVPAAVESVPSSYLSSESVVVVESSSSSRSSSSSKKTSLSNSSSVISSSGLNSGRVTLFNSSADMPKSGVVTLARAKSKSAAADFIC
jgi:hypothetical protein